MSKMFLFDGTALTHLFLLAMDYMAPGKIFIEFNIIITFDLSKVIGDRTLIK